MRDTRAHAWTSEERVRKGGDKLTKFLNAKQQGRLDGFFTAKPKTSPAKKDKAEEKGKGKGTKRKVRVSLDTSIPHSQPLHRRTTQRMLAVARRRRRSSCCPYFPSQSPGSSHCYLSCDCPSCTDCIRFPYLTCCITSTIHNVVSEICI